jgi:hypothetical protein
VLGTKSSPLTLPISDCREGEMPSKCFVVHRPMQGTVSSA